MSIRNVVFDLDGTLVDSAGGILSALAVAFERCDRNPVLPLGPEIIGPPLRETLVRLSGQDEPGVLDALGDAFKQAYDDGECLRSRAYAGVDQMLGELRAAKMRLFIATNKRALPTSKMVCHLGWKSLFELVVSPDSQVPPAIDKASLISGLMSSRGLVASETVYVGDLWHDGVAAERNAMPFVLASWGYGRPSGGRWRCAASPRDLPLAIQTLK